MNAVERSAILNEYMRTVIDVLEKKGLAYSGSDDVNTNIESTAKSLKLSKYQVWSVFFKKHIDCILNAIGNNPYTPVDNTESIDGRITDAINYLLIMKTMLIDDEKAAMVDELNQLKTINDYEELMKLSNKHRFDTKYPKYPNSAVDPIIRRDSHCTNIDHMGRPC